MTFTKMMSLSGRDFDTAVERLVFETKLCRHRDDGHGKCGRCGLHRSHWERISPPRPFHCNPAEDYEVLRHLRRLWAEDQQLMFDFVTALGRLWQWRAQFGDRNPGGLDNLILSLANEPDLSLCRFYEPGDYGRAALWVLEVVT